MGKKKNQVSKCWYFLRIVKRELFPQGISHVKNYSGNPRRWDVYNKACYILDNKLKLCVQHGA